MVALREALAAEVNTELTGVQLKVLRSANRDARARFQDRHGAEGAQLIGYLQGLGRPEAYQNLRILFDRLASLERDQDKWDVDKALWDVRFVELLDVLDDDDVEIALAVGKAGYVPIQNLSAGQRSVAVFPLLLRNSKGPLVIDQPEDNLDNRYIADIIAPDLLQRKRGQQYLVTSRNANLVVLTDADLIAHVDADGTRLSSRRIPVVFEQHGSWRSPERSRRGRCSLERAPAEVRNGVVTLKRFVRDAAEADRAIVTFFRCCRARLALGRRSEVLSRCHDMRNRTEYEGVLDVGDRLVSDLISACRKVARRSDVCRRNRRC